MNPDRIELTAPDEYVQLVVTATLKDGTTTDVTHRAEVRSDASIVQVDGSLIQAVANGQTAIQVQLGERVTEIPVTVELPTGPFIPDFRRDVNPVLTRLAGPVTVRLAANRDSSSRCAGTILCLMFAH